MTGRTLLRGGAPALAGALLALPLLAGHGRADAAPAARKPVVVKLGEYFFKPRVLTVHVGQPVRFVNVGKIAHTVADRKPGAPVPLSKLVKPRELVHGQTQTVVFRHPGLVHIFCTFHPTLMSGTIRVVP